MYSSNFLKFARKNFMWQTFSLQIFCSCWYCILHFSLPSCHRLENRMFGTVL